MAAHAFCGVHDRVEYPSSTQNLGWKAQISMVSSSPVQFRLPQAAGPVYDDFTIQVTDSPRRPRQIVVATNTLPVRLVKQGKAAANEPWVFEWKENNVSCNLRSLKEKYVLRWVGYVGFEVPFEERAAVEEGLEELGCVPVMLSQELFDQHYSVFCKTILWPLFHYTFNLTELTYDQESFAAYTAVNRAFAQKILEIVDDGDTVWIQDYHLTVLPLYLRKKLRTEIKLGLFFHSPFPSSEIFRLLRNREDILRGILCVDVVGFHIYDYARHFLSSCRRILGADTQPDCVVYHGRNITCRISHIGINTMWLNKVMEGAEFNSLVDTLRERYRGCKVVIGVDDLDSTKGIPLKIHAFQSLLAEYPTCRENTVLLQLCLPPRSPNAEVERLRNEIGYMIGRVKQDSDDHGTRLPIEFMESPFTQMELMAYMKIADVLLVSSIRDGFNMIPFDYTHVKGPEEPCCVIVSEFTGVSNLLNGAIRVNPFNTDEVRDALYEALSMADEMDEELLHRQTVNHRYVEGHDGAKWARNAIEAIDKAVADQDPTKIQYITDFGVSALNLINEKMLRVDTMEEHWRRAKTRLVILDYDGTLVRAAGVSENNTAPPPPSLLKTLSSLAADERNHVLVVSGRTRHQMRDWFGSIGRLTICAEDGVFVKNSSIIISPATSPVHDMDSEVIPSMSGWVQTVPIDDISWKAMVVEIIQGYVERTDGSVLIERECSVMWTYANCDIDYGEYQANELRLRLESSLSNQPLTVYTGQQSVVVSIQAMDKRNLGRTILHAMAEKGVEPGLVLAMGDADGDEEMFSALIDEIGTENSAVGLYPCVVGRRPGNSLYFYLDEPQDARALLKQLQELDGRRQLPHLAVGVGGGGTDTGSDGAHTPVGPNGMPLY